jgi:hypothetical protein
MMQGPPSFWNRESSETVQVTSTPSARLVSPSGAEAFAMEEKMIRGLSTVLITGTFVFSFVNAAIGGAAVGLGTDPQDRSLLSTWDMPAFAHRGNLDEVPRLNSSSPTKGPKIDFLLTPQLIRVA